jgi:DNA-binding NtrC family response regulator
MLSEHIAHPEATAMTTSLPSLDMEDNIAQLERALIGRALARAGGRRASAARLLGISRNGLTMKMARLGLIGRPDATPAPAGTGVR